MIDVDWARLENQLEAAKRAGDIKGKNKYLLQAVKALLAGVDYKNETLEYYDEIEINSFFSSFCDTAKIAVEFYDEAKPRFEPKILTDNLKKRLDKDISRVKEETVALDVLLKINEKLLEKENELREKSRQRTEIETKVSELKKIDESVEKEVAAFKAQETSLSHEIESLQTVKNNLDTAIKARKSECEILLTDNSQKNKEIEKIKKEVEEIGHQVKVAEETVAKRAAEWEALVEQKNSANDKIDKLSGEIVALNAEIDNYKSQCAHIEKELEKVTDIHQLLLDHYKENKAICLDLKKYCHPDLVDSIENQFSALDENIVLLFAVKQEVEKEAENRKIKLNEANSRVRD